jgi:molybdate transport system substrate-binding protein
LFGLRSFVQVIACALLLLAAPLYSEDLTIAAASDLQPALAEITAEFSKSTGNKVNLSFGSSGNIYSQIQNGAPYDLFFSADIAFPRKLVSAGLALPESLYQYAQGKIVLWVPKGSRLNIEQKGLQSLLDPSVRRIAIANPTHAPYGRAAKAALEHENLFRLLRDKFVIGENISQTAQFIQSGNADIGIIALSLALSPQLKSAGRYWEIPTESYPPIQQGVVILKTSKRQATARMFLDYLRQAPASRILKGYGFALPQPIEAEFVKGPK